MMRIFREQVKKMRGRLENPDYVITPADLVGTLKVIELIDSYEVRYATLFRRMKELRADLQSLNDDMFKLLSTGSQTAEPDDPLANL